MGNSQFHNIISRYFRGQLSDNEYELLANYLQDSTNREFFEQAKQEWNLDPEMEETGKTIWKRLEFKINRQNTTKFKMPVTRRLWVQVASAVAILILGFLGGGLITYFISSNPINQEQLVFETPRGEKSMVKLPDGSEVWLNANSRLVYNSFSSTHRQVELKGEAFFKVKHNAKAPFVVKTNECSVEDLGTTFNVMAYDEFGRKEITLLNGKVNVQAEGEAKVLKPGESLILKDHKMQIKEVDASQSALWVDNKFNFKNIPLSELMKRLENWYDVDITLVNKSGREVNYTGTFKNEETIWQVLDAIKVYTPIQYHKTELRKITITVE